MTAASQFYSTEWVSQHNCLRRRKFERAGLEFFNCLKVLLGSLRISSGRQFHILDPKIAIELLSWVVRDYLI